MDPTYIDLDGFDAFDLEDVNPFQRFVAASGEVDFAHHDLPAIQDTSISAINRPASSARDAAVYNGARAFGPLNLMSLPYDVQHKIYAIVLGPPTEVKIRSIDRLPYVQGSIVTPINLFLVSRRVHREAASVLYRWTKFHMRCERGISYMTGRIGLENCREIRDLTVYMQFVWNIQLTIRTVFPQLATVHVLPQQEWHYGAWYDFLHNKHGGYFQNALEEAVQTSCVAASFGLKEYMAMSQYYAVNMFLPFWNDGDKTRPPIAIPTAHAETSKVDLCLLKRTPESWRSEWKLLRGSKTIKSPVARRCLNNKILENERGKPLYCENDQSPPDPLYPPERWFP